MNTVVPERHLRKRWGTPEGEQEGESPAFRAGKGQAFPTCERREGHRESIGAQGQWCSLIKNIRRSKVTTLREPLAENSGNSRFMNFITVMSKQARKSIDEISLLRNLVRYSEDGSLLYRVNHWRTGVLGHVFFEA